MILYIGPGAGFVFTGTFFALIAALFSGFVSLFLWPVRVLLRSLKGAKAYKDAKVKRVVFLGLDGLDPKLCERYMEEGKMPNLAKLRDKGTYSRLRTTFPCLSPVAWSCFATGANPAKHNIFGFLSRDPKTYAPELSSSKVKGPSRVLKLGKWEIPWGKPVIEMKRKSVPFWKILGEHEIHSTILRIPITFPPDEFNGHMLSAMCTPDLRGTQGSFTFYSEGIVWSENQQGMRLPLEKSGDGEWSASFNGPNDPRDPKGKEVLKIPFTLTKIPGDKELYRLRVSGTSYDLAPGEYSEWVPLVFKTGVFGGAKGIARVLITKTDPLSLYVTPINIDPGAPSLPISQPGSYAVYLSRLMGSFATLGLAEDTWALNESVIDENHFLDQAYLNHKEREEMFFNALDKTPRGVVACVFDASDRIQHMFFRTFDEKHPANKDRETKKFATVIEEMYMKMDELVGRAQAKLGPDDVFIVLSDHGFETFQRGVNLNSWLRDEGYLVLKNGDHESGDYFENVDWDKTRAYSVGLGGIYLNRKNREAKGFVTPGDEADKLKEEIAEKLSGLMDPDRDDVAVRQVFRSDKLYKGPYLAAGPDLLIGYNKGYRAAWAAATGGVTAEVFEDNTKAWGGDHCIDPKFVPGIFFCNRELDVDDPGIEDMAPTTLEWFGVKPPRHMDGKSWADVGDDKAA